MLRRSDLLSRHPLHITDTSAGIKITKMGLGFHIGQGGIDDLGEYLGDMSMEEHYWLQKNRYLFKGTTGHLPEDLSISLPYFDDVILTHEEVLEIKANFDKRKSEVIVMAGFKSSVIERMETILNRLAKEQEGLSTMAD